MSRHSVVAEAPCLQRLARELRVRDDAQFKRWLREQADLARYQAQEDDLLSGRGRFF